VAISVFPSGGKHPSVESGSFQRTVTFSPEGKTLVAIFCVIVGGNCRWLVAVDYE
jgi:hypothetical protein